MKSAQQVWAPSRGDVEGSRLSSFIAFCEARTGASFEGWAAFHEWSCVRFRDFWAAFFDWSGLGFSGDASVVCEGDDCEGATFFPDLRLNYARNLLRAGSDESGAAIVAIGETGSRVVLDRAQLRDRVRRASAGLKGMGVGPGTRVVAVGRNDADTVVACLAVTGLGATWSSVAPDQGAVSILSRFEQIQPSVLLAHASRTYQGARRDLGDTLARVVEGLPSLEHVVGLDDDSASSLGGVGPPVSTLGDGDADVGTEDAWPELPFNHPLFIMFSSGTTGTPKCLVHGAGGTLLEHAKEHMLHCDVGPGDRVFFQTSAGWMMWNWQLSALAAGASIVLYEGSPSHPNDDQVWRVVADEGVTRFGTSPAYLQYCEEAGIVPRERVDLSRLKAVMSTGSVLYEGQFDWVRESVGDVPVQSISGGTDIIGCFVLGNPNLPVYRGESQCLSLAMDVRSLGQGDGSRDLPGELVCTNPFPSRPLGILGDEDARRFHDTYFAANEGVWTHGDFVEITDRGTARVLGRSDGVMNLRGVRVGPAEIYRVVNGFPEVKGALAVEQADSRVPGGSRMVLLLTLADGETLERPLVLRIKKRISMELSMAHVPAVVEQVAELPETYSGKVSEKAARDAVNGREAANAAALRNPGCLEEIAALPGLGKV